MHRVDLRAARSLNPGVPRIQISESGVPLVMVGTWLQDLESFEEISQNDDTRRIFLRMAHMQRTGSIGTFLTELEDEPGIDADTKGTLVELAHDTDFLLAVEDYCEKTFRLH